MKVGWARKLTSAPLHAPERIVRPLVLLVVGSFCAKNGFDVIWVAHRNHVQAPHSAAKVTGNVWWPGLHTTSQLTHKVYRSPNCSCHRANCIHGAVVKERTLPNTGNFAGPGRWATFNPCRMFQNAAISSTATATTTPYSVALRRSVAYCALRESSLPASLQLCKAGVRTRLSHRQETWQTPRQSQPNQP